jgi:hypothetical protein
MKKEFVPFDLSLRLKELGFDEPCFGYFVDGELRGINLGIEELGGIEPYYQRFGFHTLTNHNIDNPNKIVVTAPTFSQAFKWFRERDFHTTIESYHCLGNDKPFGLGIDQKINGIWDYVDYSGDGNFDTYEEAQIKAIESILEIMEKKIS